MRSLALKLTLAFLIVGLTGASLVAFFVSRQTQRQFDQFVLDRYHLDLVEELANYYETQGSWENLNAVFVANRNRPQGGHRHGWIPVTVVDADNVVVVGGSLYQPGARLGSEALRQAFPIEVNGRVVGRILLTGTAGQGSAPPESPEFQFIAGVRRAIIYSALVATAIALLLGMLLARTISEPVQALIQATRRVAQGDLNHEAPVRSRDEIGQLAASFNQMTANLARSNELRRQMTADIAHDLRTPTSVILGYTEALSDGKLQGTADMYQIMHKEAQQLNHMIEDLRTLSLADAGELPLVRQTVSPQALLADAAAAYQVQASNQGVTLRVEAATDLPSIHVDPGRINQVLANLISNALRHTPSGGEVVLAATHQAERLILSVKDTGSGIAPEDLPHIFRRFYRSDKARSQNGESGLGLAIARSIVEMHNGRISAESFPGQGTTLTITLPVR